jgi:hypothetical protein
VAVGGKSGLEKSTVGDGESLAGVGVLVEVGSDRARLFQLAGIGVQLAAAGLRPGAGTAVPAVLAVGGRNTALLPPLSDTASRKLSLRLRCFGRPGIAPDAVELPAELD